MQEATPRTWECHWEKKPPNTLGNPAESLGNMRKVIPKAFQDP